MGGPPRRRPVAVLVVCGRQERPAAIPGRCEGRTASDPSDRRRCGYEQRNECETGSAERRRERPAAPRSDALHRGRVRVVPALDRTVVHGQSRRGRLRRPVGAVDPLGRGFLDGGGEGPVSGGMDVLLAVAGAMATLLVIAGMILITPRGEVEMERDAPGSQGTNLSRADLGEAPSRASAGA